MVQTEAHLTFFSHSCDAAEKKSLYVDKQYSPSTGEKNKLKKTTPQSSSSGLEKGKCFFLLPLGQGYLLLAQGRYIFTKNNERNKERLAG